MKNSKELKEYKLIDEIRQGLNKPNLIFINLDEDISSYQKPIKKVVETKETGSIEPDSTNKQHVSSTDNSIAELDNFFNTIWKELPSKMKKGKSAVKKTQRIKLMKVGKEKLNQCLKLYLLEVKRENKFMLNGSTWFNGRYEDYINLDSSNIFEDEIKQKEIEDDFFKQNGL